jgi:glycosyltransferase involved in cell wall biosynthesis
MRIGFAWPGLPDYAARCIRMVIESNNSQVTVVATKPVVPIEGMEHSLGQRVHWVEGNKAISWAALGTVPSDILFVGGYSLPAFNALASEVREAGGKVVLMSDNNWTNSIIQKVVEPIRHRLMFRHRFDGIFVPGVSGERVAKSWGYSPTETASGLYGADSSLFHGGKALHERGKTILSVGQFIERKNVVGLAEAFVQVADKMPGWKLALCGSGPLANRLPVHPRVEVHGFVQPTQLADMLRSARCLVLPSIEEHWGLVVHEAALSGCALALSKTVGAADDLARPENALLFPPGQINPIAAAILEISRWNDLRWEAAEAMSRRLAAGFGPARFVAGVERLTAKLQGAVK